MLVSERPRPSDLGVVTRNSAIGRILGIGLLRARPFSSCVQPSFLKTSSVHLKSKSIRSFNRREDFPVDDFKPEISVETQ